MAAANPLQMMVWAFTHIHIFPKMVVQEKINGSHNLEIQCFFFWNVNVNSFKFFVCPLKPENGGFHLECEPSCVSIVLLETCFSSGENWQSNIRVIREILLI